MHRLITSAMEGLYYTCDMARECEEQKDPQSIWNYQMPHFHPFVHTLKAVMTTTTLTFEC